MMLTDILVLLLGLTLIILGAEWLVDGASAIARKLNISEKVTKLLGMLRQHQQYFYIRQLSKESIFKFSNSIFDL